MGVIEWDDMIDSIRLEEVIAGLDIGIVEIKKGEHWANCPLPTHPGADSSPSFSINEDTLLYNCFTCNEGGPLPLLVASLLGYESDETTRRWDKALEWLLPYSDGDVATDHGYMEQLDRYLDRPHRIKQERPQRQPLPFFIDKVVTKLDYSPLELVATWNIHEQETIEHFNLRYDPERYRRKDGKTYTGPALVIPHYFGGALVGYQERWLGDRPDWLPKYTNSEHFPKALTIYNWDGVLEAACRGLPVIVVESTMTVIRLWELGYTAVATFGAGVRDEQIRLLSSLHCGVVLAFDSDPDYLNAKGELVTGAGKKALKETRAKLVPYVPVEIVEGSREDKSDFADLPEEAVHAAINGRVLVWN